MNEKLEELLRLALQTPEEVRARTEDLNVGFDSFAKSWELIVKYHDSLDGLEALGIMVEYLIAGYAILTVPEKLVEAVAALEEIEYVEKPKRFFYGQVRPTEGSCITPVTLREPFLTGEGVLVAVLDSGIDYRLPEFLKSDKTTRIRYLWDQTVRGKMQSPPTGFFVGAEYDAGQINEALNADSSEEQFMRVPSVDAGGHGTAVAGIAVGSSSRYRGVAEKADLLVVKLGIPDAASFPRTTEIMRGVTYSVKKALALNMPLVINLSFGNTYGPHDGSSLLERFLDNAAEIGRTVICVGSGNEGSNGGHFAGRILNGQEGRAELAIGEYETTLSVQIWMNYSDEYRVFLRSPGGQETELSELVNGGKYTIRLEQTEILVYVGEPTPYSAAREIYLDMLPVGQNYINSGVWTFRIAAAEQNRQTTGNFYFYLPGGAVRSSATGFFRPTPDMTLTIPSTAAKVITVGAYDSVYDSYADFSGRGYADPDRTVGVVPAGLVKPDLVAPGVNVLAPDLFGGLTGVTGTSFATPIVSGSVALMMEWGIVRGNDPFLYGEKVKAYLQRGARPLRGEETYPNDRVGWGALCVADSIPRG